MFCKQRELPWDIPLPACMVDPFNDKNHFIFGGWETGTCWKYENTDEKYKILEPTRNSKKCFCAPFIFNNLHYALILGDSNGYHIYKFPKNNDNPLAHNFTHFPSFQHETATVDMMSFAMVTDVFRKNRIHIINYNKYGYFEFKDAIGYIFLTHNF